MNRAERRRQARAHGWRGSKSKKGADFVVALEAADTALKADAARAEQEAWQAEQDAHRQYVEKIRKAALATRDMGLVIPGQE